ncbi:unnamed protein product [Danaus chrysippus]|uniref:(African queen) hypothetical protein n=1 Tax=Danaus chrysippus TaxID=151541 RepID=A0A8J2QSE3_9NEOP|nr:unnamed protein product [Danaus chrysippus]
MAIKTFVFFDLETTGLPYQEKNRTKITELTFVAVSRNDLENAECNALPPTNKLSLLFNPQKHISEKVCNLTGLTNHCLKNQAIFKDKIRTINSFLELPKPVCLIAHNGNRFDYKILLSEYLDANESLPTDLLCVDSLSGFRHVMKNSNIEQCKKKKICTSYDYNVEDTCDWPELDISNEDWDKIDSLVASFSELNSSSTDNKKMSYSLSSLYKTLLGKETVNAHRAETDCIMLLECVLAVKKDFLPWADAKCKPIKEIKPLIRM